MQKKITINIININFQQLAATRVQMVGWVPGSQQQLRTSDIMRGSSARRASLGGTTPSGWMFSWGLGWPWGRENKMASLAVKSWGQPIFIQTHVNL